ncbi:MAG: hypothetical protein HY700_11120 [Gemmatimonadetes bacterium]|nr:hypothetical protein [Gemmatimonadota bacterium]
MIPSIRARPALGRLLAALPNAGVAVAYATAAADPALRDGAMGTALWRAGVLEFFAIHASGFLKVTWIVPAWSATRRARLVAALAGAYSVVLGAVSVVVGSAWPLVTFWALTGNRVLDAALRDAPTGKAMTAEAHAWAGNVVLFVLVAAAAGIAGAGRLAVLVAGAVYFAADAVSELGDWWWVYRWQAWARRRTASTARSR